MIGKCYTTENTMASNMDKIIRSCYDLNRDWTNKLEELECELDHSRQSSEENINIKDQEIAELKRKLEESERKRQEVEKEMENFKKHRKELLNLAVAVSRKSSGPTYKDHKDKLVVAATNLYSNLNDICKDFTRKVKKYLEGGPVSDDRKRPVDEYDISIYIRRAQSDINARLGGWKKGYITKQNVEPTIHKVEMDKVMDRYKRRLNVNLIEAWW